MSSQSSSWGHDLVVMAPGLLAWFQPCFIHMTTVFLRTHCFPIIAVRNLWFNVKVSLRWFAHSVSEGLTARKSVTVTECMSDFSETTGAWLVFGADCICSAVNCYCPGLKKKQTCCFFHTKILDKISSVFVFSLTAIQKSLRSNKKGYVRKDKELCFGELGIEDVSKWKKWLIVPVCFNFLELKNSCVLLWLYTIIIA